MFFSFFWKVFVCQNLQIASVAAFIHVARWWTDACNTFQSITSVRFYFSDPGTRPGSFIWKRFQCVQREKEREKQKQLFLEHQKTHCMVTCIAEYDAILSALGALFWLFFLFMALFWKKETNNSRLSPTLPGQNLVQLWLSQHGLRSPLFSLRFDLAPTLT